MGSSRTLRPKRRCAVVGLAAIALAAPLLTATGGAVSAAPPTRVLLTVANSSDLSAVSADVTHSGGQVLQSFPVAAAVEVELPAGVAPPTDAVVVPDQQFRFNSAPSVGADAPVNTYRQTIDVPDELRGAGVTVALVDTGVADTGEIDVEHLNVSGGPQGDGYGHGTFLGGLIAGDGGSSDGVYRGVAPDADLLDVQVALPDGSTSLSRVLAGLQAVSDRAETDPSLKVLALALSTQSPLPPHLDPVTRALRNVWADGVTVVVAAGNDGAGEVASPASDPALLAVGATDDAHTVAPGDDEMADYSAYGKSFGVDRPDVVVPGNSLVSLGAPGSVAVTQNPGSVVLDKYFKGTGTSMSAAVTAGAVAALTAVRDDLVPNDVKRLLMGTADTTKAISRRTGAGAGVVDLAEAVATDVADTRKLRYEWDSTQYGPDDADDAAWDAFTAAWAAGNLRAAVAAWIQLSPQTRRWAANAWSLAVLTNGMATDDDADFDAREWAGRRWSTEKWAGRRWSTDNWVGRRWSTIDWTGRRWSTDTWLSPNWEGRRWSSEDWLAFAWSVRTGSAEIAELWADETFEGRRWSELWTGRRWSGRRWSEQQWEGRRWSTEDWAGRRWSITDWAGRRWSDQAWAGRRWSDFNWDGRRWSDGEWTGRRWSEFAFEGRRWSTEQWTGRRWSVTAW